MLFIIFFFFFFQAEDGIRDTSVTGVQTCALPICFSSIQSEIIFIMARIYSTQYVPCASSLVGFDPHQAVGEPRVEVGLPVAYAVPADLEVGYAALLAAPLRQRLHREAGDLGDLLGCQQSG